MLNWTNKNEVLEETRKSMSDTTQNLLPTIGEGFDIKPRLRQLWAGKATLGTMMMIGLSLGFLVTYLQTPTYRTSTLVQIDPPRRRLEAPQNPHPALATYRFGHRSYYETQYRIIRSTATGARALRKLGLLDEPPFGNIMNPSAVFMSHIQVVPLRDTRLVQIAATHVDPATAAAWANAVSDAFIDQSIESRVEATHNIYSRIVDKLSKEQDETTNKHLYETILQGIENTDVASSIWSANVSIVERATVPQTPFRPDRIKSAILSLMGGLAIGIGILFLRNRTDATIKAQDDVENYLRTDCLAVVPRHGDTFDGVATEAYQSLRFSLLLSRERERGNVVLVTSSVPEEGKSTTALNIARALAGAGESTLLLDFDLRRSNIHKRLQLSVRPGLSDYFVRDFPLLQSIVQKTRFSNLYAIVPGRLPANPPSFIGSPAVKRLLDEARERYTWILLNAPPILGFAHPRFMSELADMTLMVVRSNMVDRRLVRRCMSTLTNTNARLIGAVLNGVEPGHDPFQGRNHANSPCQPTQQATVTPIRRAAWRAR